MQKDFFYNLANSSQGVQFSMIKINDLVQLLKKAVNMANSKISIIIEDKCKPSFKNTIVAVEQSYEEIGD